MAGLLSPTIRKLHSSAKGARGQQMRKDLCPRVHCPQRIKSTALALDKEISLLFSLFIEKIIKYFTHVNDQLSKQQTLKLALSKCASFNLFKITDRKIRTIFTSKISEKLSFTFLNIIGKNGKNY